MILSLTARPHTAHSTSVSSNPGDSRKEQCASGGETSPESAERRACCTPANQSVQGMRGYPTVTVRIGAVKR